MVVSMSGPLGTVVGRRWSHGRQSTNDTSNSIKETTPKQKPLASGKGIDIYISLVESVLFLRGFEGDTSAQHTVVLRGMFHLHVTKSTKIRAITLVFHGKATTRWPNGDCSTFFVHTHTLTQQKAFLLRGSGSRRQIRSSIIRGHSVHLKWKCRRLGPVLTMSDFLNVFH